MAKWIKCAKHAYEMQNSIKSNTQCEQCEQYSKCQTPVEMTNAAQYITAFQPNATVQKPILHADIFLGNVEWHCQAMTALRWGNKVWFLFDVSFKSYTTSLCRTFCGSATFRLFRAIWICHRWNFHLHETKQRERGREGESVCVCALA